MLKSLLGILVCPFDKVSTLELFELETKNNNQLTPLNNNKSKSAEVKRFSKDSLNYKNTNDALKTDNDYDNNVSNDLKTFDSKGDDLIIEGILFCNTCLRFYPIIDEIPIILPDELRDKSRDLEFLKKHIDSLPQKIIEDSLPWHL